MIQRKKILIQNIVDVQQTLDKALYGGQMLSPVFLPMHVQHSNLFTFLKIIIILAVV